MEDGVQDVALVLVDVPSEVRDVYAWLREDPELRRWVDLVESPPAEGTLGPVAEAVQIVADAPEVVATLAGVLIAWLRYRTSDVKIRIRRSATDTEMEVTANRVKTMNAAQVQELRTQLEAALNTHPPLLPASGSAGSAADPSPSEEEADPSPSEPESEEETDPSPSEEETGGG
ncbi:hypothetical protein ABZU75_40500 [Streptosporangium sp. NPDC005286]|uniref:effector-associated constant component EACC1 n=1 Tax=Streptosporangium sp. NPDC005286 TaxID=3154463 RepID=UPI0033A01222